MFLIYKILKNVLRKKTQVSMSSMKEQKDLGNVLCIKLFLIVDTF